MERIKFIAQKRATLKMQITNLHNLFAQEKIDTVNSKMWLQRITELLHAYEELQDELAILDPENDRLSEFSKIQDRFYDLASRIKRAEASDTSHNDTLNIMANLTDKPRRIKFPIPELLKFDGKMAFI